MAIFCQPGIPSPIFQPPPPLVGGKHWLLAFFADRPLPGSKINIALWLLRRGGGLRRGLLFTHTSTFVYDHPYWKFSHWDQPKNQPTNQIMQPLGIKWEGYSNALASRKRRRPLFWAYTQQGKKQFLMFIFWILAFEQKMYTFFLLSLGLG